MNHSSEDQNQRRWRIIQHTGSVGAWNMAMDEAILEFSAQKKSPPTLRLYAWTPPCLSLGYAQNALDVDIQALDARGWQMVRRPTGGRAILHTDEITYAVIAPEDNPLVAGGVLESYRRLSGALLNALLLLGLDARADQAYPTTTGTTSAVCFETPSNYEITVLGKKLIGSAQARRSAGVLQHGSLPLAGDLTRITQVLAFTDENLREKAATRLLEHATTLESVLGVVIGWETAVRAFAQAFSQTFGISLEPGELSKDEVARAKQLMTEKYNNPAWTQRL